MSYFEGFVVAVPAANKEAYLKQAKDGAPLFLEFGATRMVETWGEDVPDGKVTDFKGAVKAEPGEVVVFSWFEYPDKTTRDAAVEKMMADPRMKEMGANMPFDGKRMIVGGFEAIVDDQAGGRMGYTDGYLIACPNDKREAYIDVATKASALFRQHGATRVVEAWGDDVPDGKVTDYRSAVKAKDNENVLFSWVEWPSKQAREEGWKKVMADDQMKKAVDPMPFDGQRMIYGGFEPILDVKA
jgi:uncharacterized protein YbaA (DUF1428 family)